MKFATLEVILRVLTERGVRFLVAGGVAVNAHGYRRVTDDLDLALAMDEHNLLAAFGALEALGYRPSLPVTAEDFADRTQRNEWVEKRNLRVLSLISDQHRDATIDLFAQEPFDFEKEYAGAKTADVAPDLAVRFVRLTTLIRMKREVGRPRDLDDVAHLEEILRMKESQ